MTQYLSRLTPGPPMPCHPRFQKVTRSADERAATSPLGDFYERSQALLPQASPPAGPEARSSSPVGQQSVAKVTLSVSALLGSSKFFSHFVLSLLSRCSHLVLLLCSRSGFQRR